MRVAMLALVLQACVVEATPVNNGYGYGYGPPSQGNAEIGVNVDATPTPYDVSSMPPEPLYEQMSASPGYGYSWIDGYWHWNQYEWVWVSGRWERGQEGRVYVAPYYDYVSGRYVYTPGYWSAHDRVPTGWALHDRHDGRPPVYAPPSGWHNPQPARAGGARVEPVRGSAPVRPAPAREPRKR